MQKNVVKQPAGFTLIEIMIVIAFIAGLLAYFGQRFMHFGERAKINQTKLQLEDIRSALNLYRQDMGKYPLSREGGLDNLMKTPRPKGRWSGPYLTEKQIKDPWGHDIQYFAPPRDKAYGAYQVISYGTDGEESDDDIELAEKEI